MEVKKEFEGYLQLSDSRRACFEQCSKKYYWRYRHEDTGIQPHFGSTALRYGRVWHFALESMYDFVKVHGWKGEKDGENLITFVARMVDASWEEESKGREFSEDYRTKENLINAFFSYLDTFMEERSYLEVVQPEQAFQIPMEITEEEIKQFPSLKGVKLLITGIMDLIARLHSQLWVIEHKTTGTWMQSIIDTLQRSAQTQGYYWAGGEIAQERIEGVMINIHHLSSRRKKDGTYGVTKIEFARHPEIYTKGDINSWRESILYTVSKIQDGINLNRWPMNLGSCHLYNRKCEYTALCEQNKPPAETNTMGFLPRQEV